MRQRWRFVVAVCVFLAGCAVTGNQRLYDGPARGEAELALVDVPDQVQLLSIDGRDLPGGLLQRKQTVELLPGERVLTLRYVELFQFGAGDHEVVRSRPAALRVTLAAGQRYRVTVENRPTSLEMARKYARDPAFALTALASGEVTLSSPIKSFAEASLIDTLNKAFVSAQEAPSAMPGNLDLLKDVWGRATPAEREQFRQWLGSEGR